jgi:hypothetical protein
LRGAILGWGEAVHSCEYGLNLDVRNLVQTPMRSLQLNVITSPLSMNVIRITLYKH